MTIPHLTLGNIWKVYYYIALFSTILFFLKLAIFNFVGGDSEVVSDFNAETDTDLSFNFISSQTIISFFMGFGWMGYAGLNQFAFGHLRNFLIAFSVGILFMFATALLMYGVKKLEKNVKKDKSTALNQVAKAYTNFEPMGLGQVEAEINGQLSVVNASNSSDEAINAFDLVRVVKVVDDLLYIEKIKK